MQKLRCGHAVFTKDTFQKKLPITTPAHTECNYFRDKSTSYEILWFMLEYAMTDDNIPEVFDGGAREAPKRIHIVYFIFI